MAPSETCLDSHDAKRDAASLVLFWTLKPSFLDVAQSNLIEAAYLIRRKATAPIGDWPDALKEPSPFDTPSHPTMNFCASAVAALSQAKRAPIWASCRPWSVAPIFGGNLSFLWCGFLGLAEEAGTGPWRGLMFVLAFSHFVVTIWRRSGYILEILWLSCLER